MIKNTKNEKKKNLALKTQPRKKKKSISYQIKTNILHRLSNVRNKR